MAIYSIPDFVFGRNSLYLGAIFSDKKVYLTPSLAFPDKPRSLLLSIFQSVTLVLIAIGLKNNGRGRRGYHISKI
ncbi:MAG: hypothetical protein ACRD8W_07925 [Nitrososphaeraceae archaeon]